MPSIISCDPALFTWCPCRSRIHATRLPRFDLSDVLGATNHARDAKTVSLDLQLEIRNMISYMISFYKSSSRTSSEKDSEGSTAIPTTVTRNSAGLFAWNPEKAAWHRHDSQASDFTRLGLDDTAWPMSCLAEQPNRPASPAPQHALHRRPECMQTPARK